MLAACALLSAVLLACNARQLGFPRTPLQATSPDGIRRAFVRNHAEFDPPNQSLWIEDEHEKRHKLQHLGSDSDWVDQIAWSADGSTCAFLVQGARAVVVDAHRNEIIASGWLFDYRGNYPPARRVDRFELSDDGSVVRSTNCPRLGGTCTELAEHRVAQLGP